MFPSWVKNLVLFDLRFGFLVKNCIYGQILVKICQNPVNFGPHRENQRVVHEIWRGILGGVWDYLGLDLELFGKVFRRF